MSKARDIADLDFNSPDIDGGNIDGATIGGTTPAAGSFSNVNVGGQNILNDNYDAVGAIFRRNGSHGAVISLGRQGVGDGVTLDYPSDNTFAVSTAGVERFQISSGGAATFNSSITIPDYVIHDGNTATKFGFGSANTINFNSNGSDRLTIANSYAVFNEAGTDYDFRVESDGNANMLFVDGGNNRVGVGTDSPSSMLTVGAPNTINTKKATVQITDTSVGASLALRGQSPTLVFDATAGGVPKILMDAQGIEFKSGTIDSEGSVDLKIDSSGVLTVGGAGIQGATTDPTITTNPADEGHIWINTTSGSMYICRDNTSNNNVWQSLTHESEDIVPAARFSGAYDFFGDGSAKALWQFDGNAVDTGGNYDGQVQAGVSLTPARQAMYGTKTANFNGTGSILIPFIANTFRRTDAFTISFWLTRKGTLPSSTLPFSFNAHAANRGRGAGIYAGACWRQSTSTSNSMYGGITGFSVADGDHFVVVGNTNATTTLYKNGSLHATSAVATLGHTNQSGGYGGEIGGHSHGEKPTNEISSMGYFDCSVDQFRVFNKAVSASEATALYNEGA